MLDQPLEHPDRVLNGTGATHEFLELAQQLSKGVPPEGVLTLKRMLQALLPHELGRIAHDTLHMLIDRRGAEDEILSVDQANDGDDPISLDAEAKDFIRRRLQTTVLKDLNYDLVGEGIGSEDRTRRPNGWIWIVTDPLDGSKYFETTGEGAAVAIGGFMQIGPNRVERLAVAVASTAGRTTVTASHSGTARVSVDGLNFFEVATVPAGRLDAVAMVTGRNPQKLRYLADLAEALELRGDAQAGNPALPKLLLWGTSLIVQPGPHKIYDAFWLYALARRDDVFVTDLVSGKLLRLADLDDAVSAWVAAGCRNDHRTIPPYVVATTEKLGNAAREAALNLGLYK